MTTHTDPRLLPVPIGVMRGVFHVITDADDHFLQIVGYTRDDFTQGVMNWAQMTPPEYLHHDQAGMRQAAESGGFTAPYQKQFIRKDGSRVDVLLVVAFIPETEGGWIGYVVNLSSQGTSTATARDNVLPLSGPLPHDMLARLVGELVRERDRLHAMMNNTPALIWAVDTRCHLLSANAPFQEAQAVKSGRPLEIGDDVLSDTIYDDTTIGPWPAWYARALAGERFSERLSYGELEETPYTSEYFFSPIIDASGDIKGVTVLSQDITARVNAETLLRASEARFRSLATSLPVGIFIADATYALTYVNPRFAEIWGPTSLDVDGHRYLEAIHPDDTSLLHEGWAPAAQGAPSERMFRIRHPDGGVRTVRWQTEAILQDDRLVGYVGSMEDETERQAETQRAQQREKMESLGTLAGGIAHDLNNMLGVILGFADLAASPEATPAQHTESFEAIRTASLRTRELVQQILTFSRRSERVMVPLDLTAITTESGRLLRAAIPMSVQMRVEVPGTPVTILGDAASLQQVLVNLCTNAEHALRGADNPTLTIRLEQRQHEERATALLTVADNGPGIPADVRSRIFEPFYTTKAVGEGTGMGLAVVHGIVTAHGGEITISTAGGNGSLFSISLPTTTEHVASSLPVEVTGGSPRATARILVVEDEPELARFALRALTRSGYTAVTVQSAADALEYLATAVEHVDLVITDLTMPGMLGNEFARLLAERFPAMPCILMSGFLDNLQLSEIGGLQAPRALLEKPFSAAELVQAIQQFGIAQQS